MWSLVTVKCPWSCFCEREEAKCFCSYMCKLDADLSVNCSHLQMSLNQLPHLTLTKLSLVFRHLLLVRLVLILATWLIMACLLDGWRMQLAGILYCGRFFISSPENCDLALCNFCAVLTFSRDHTIFTVEHNFHAKFLQVQQIRFVTLEPLRHA